MSGMWKRSHGRTSKAPPDERGGYRYVRPTAAAPHLDSTCAVQRRRFPVGASPTRRFAPAGSDRSSHGGNEMAVTSLSGRGEYQPGKNSLSILSALRAG